MTRTVGMWLATWTLALGLLAALAAPAPAASPEARALEILDATGVEGGFVVHLGCGNGGVTAALRASDAYLVHGLARSADALEKARDHVRSKGLYGAVSIDRFESDRLPYAGNLVTLLVADDLGGVAMDEVMRVLAPGGVALVAGQKTVKPRPQAIDDWTHFLHGPDNNAVADDTRVGPPRHMQWVAGPVWARSHDHLASVSAAVSSGGRLFSIVDEGPVASVGAPARWRLVARDAFSGVLLWKREIGPWEDHLRPFRSGPTELPRRLVALGDRVYVTLGYGKPVVALDAATGEVVRTYEGTTNAHEILLSGGRLYLVVSEPPPKHEGTATEVIRRLGPWTGRSVYKQYVVRYLKRRLVVLDADTGKTVWQRADDTTARILPTTPAVSGGRLFFQNKTHLVALDADTGKTVWQAERPVSRHRPAFSSPTLVVRDGVVLSADRAAGASAKTGGKDKDRMEWLVSSTMISTRGQMIAFSADTGERLWSAPCAEAFNAPVDVFVAHGKVWSGHTIGKGHPGITKVYDLHTGKVVDERPKDQKVFTVGFAHGRCYRNKATTRYVIHGRAGVEFVDMHSHDVIADHWVRGTCQYGVLPCNGLLYAPPHSCACYNEAKLNAFNCLAPASAQPDVKPDPAATRLERGPAYGKSNKREWMIANAAYWPMYRADAARSGRTPASVPDDVKPVWQADLGGTLSSVTYAFGLVFVARVDRHEVCALNATTGEVAWTATAGGRVDSPPTLWHGRVYFGDASGHVTCLRVSDGALVWRFRAAPEDRRVVAFGRLESAWPVHGSVLVMDGQGAGGRPLACAVAGRSTFLDGGLFLYGLDARTGQVVFERRLSNRDPKTGREPQKTITGKRGTYMPGALPDVLSSDGESIFMRHARFDTAGKSLPPTVDHLFSPAGFLDDSWWHRTYWLIGTEMLPDYHGWPVMGCERLTGRLLVSAGDRVFGFGRADYAKAGSHLGVNTVYRLFAAHAELGPPKPPEKPPGDWWRSFPGSRVKGIWSKRIPFYVRAMVLAGDILFVAGPTEVGDFAADAPEGEVHLWAVSDADGEPLAKYRLAAPPVWDGMAATDGRLYLATTHGRVIAFGK